MADPTIGEIIATLTDKKKYFFEEFGITKIGIFGSFAKKEQNRASDIDIIIDMVKDKKNLHNFLQFKRVLEKEFQRSVDIGFEHTLKPKIREKVKGQITYV